LTWAATQAKPQVDSNKHSYVFNSYLRTYFVG
jgi:hypothetical protein